MIVVSQAQEKWPILLAMSITQGLIFVSQRGSAQQQIRQKECLPPVSAALSD
ncbi:MAG: hypothetical protein AB1749_01105 [Pseudomonadota bacterium]